MQKSNYALVSALYANKTKGLYSDIYFPIIRYALIKIFIGKVETDTYSSADEVAEYIDEKFGIHIPTIVIAKSITKISMQKDENLQLVIYEGGQSFHINKALFSDDELDIEMEERFFSDNLETIEREYKSFIGNQGCTDDSISFLQFISDNTDDILGYFDGEDKTRVDDKYATLIFFLQYLHESNLDLYTIVNQLFWSSIIVAFLKSERPLVEDSENGVKAEFYLDTSIILGLLDLSTPMREAYSKEVFTIIRNSGGILRVNPLTIDEVTYILKSVEQNGANPLTDIASACERKELLSNQIAQIRLNIDSILAKIGIQIFPVMAPSEKQRVVAEYKGKKVTKLLGEFRSKKPESYSRDNYREIHDLYLNDFIKRRRKDKNDTGNIFFLTNNIELITFCKTQNNGESYMISTGKVVLDLWMHYSKPINISNCVLTETMARCLELHRSNVRYKLAEVARFLNKTKDNFDPKVYKDFIGHLYRRAKNVISTVEANPDSQDSAFAKLITEAVEADNRFYNSSLAKVQKDNEELKQATIQKDSEIKKINTLVNNLQGQNNDKDKQISALSSAKQDLEANLQKHRSDLEILKKSEEAAKASALQAEQINQLYKDRDSLNAELERLEADLTPLELLRHKSFKNYSPPLWFVFGLLMFLIFISTVVLVYLNIFAKWTIPLGIVGASFGMFCLNRFYSLKEKTEERAEKAYKNWDAKKENKKYNLLKEQISSKKERLKEINVKLKQI